MRITFQERIETLYKSPKHQEEAKLMADFCSLFDDRFWGFETPKAWFPAIKMFVEWLSKQTFETKIFQIKEKFGRCRIYISESNEQTDHMISFIEGILYCTCANCGTMELELKRKPGDWVTYICKSCYERELNESRRNEEDDCENGETEEESRVNSFT